MIEDIFIVMSTKVRKAKYRTILLSVALGIGILQPLSASAQPDWFHGLFGMGIETQNPISEGGGNWDGVMNENLDGLEYYDNYEYGLFNRGDISTSNLFIQGFGATPTSGINVEPFNESPLGGGLFIMLISGAGYVLLKKRESNESNQ